MGCDIHAYIETVVTYKHSEDKTSTYRWAHPFILRDYVLFGALADVRVEMGKRKPKGIPDIETLDYETKQEYGYEVDDEGADKYPPNEWDGTHPYVTQAQADEWVSRAGSVLTPGHTETRNGSREVTFKPFVSNPDWHSASWLDLDELIQAQKDYTNWYAEDKVYFHAVDDGLAGAEKFIAHCHQLDALFTREQTREYAPATAEEVFHNEIGLRDEPYPGTAAQAKAIIAVKTTDRGQPDRHNHDLDAIVAAMKCLRYDEDGHKQEPRLVFWFDN